MFIKFNAGDVSASTSTVEIATFEGIRYDADSEYAILSTEHVQHDYLMPMKKDVYEAFVDKVYAMLAKSLMSPGLMLTITGSPLIRVKSGSMTRRKGTDDYRYGLEWQQQPEK